MHRITPGSAQEWAAPINEVHSPSPLFTWAALNSSSHTERFFAWLHCRTSDWNIWFRIEYKVKHNYFVFLGLWFSYDFYWSSCISGHIDTSILCIIGLSGERKGEHLTFELLCFDQALHHHFWNKGTLDTLPADHVAKFLCFDDIAMGTAQLLCFLRALWAVRSEDDVHVSSGAGWVSGGEGARLRLLLDLRADQRAGLWSLHGHMRTGIALPASERGGKTSSRSASRQRALHKRENV